MAKEKFLDKRVVDYDFVDAMLDRIARDSAGIGRLATELYGGDGGSYNALEAVNKEHENPAPWIAPKLGDLVGSQLIPIAVAGSLAYAYPSTPKYVLGLTEGATNVGIGYGTAHNNGKPYSLKDATADTIASVMSYYFPKVTETGADGLVRRGASHELVNLGKGFVDKSFGSVSPDIVKKIREETDIED